MSNSDGTWRGSPQELMESLETEGIIPAHDSRRGFGVCWTDDFSEYPITNEHLLSFAVLGKSKILQIEELVRQYMVDVMRTTEFRFSFDKIVWVCLSSPPTGVSRWMIGKNLKFMANGNVYVGQEGFTTSGLDVSRLGARIFDLHTDGVMISYDNITLERSE